MSKKSWIALAALGILAVSCARLPREVPCGEVIIDSKYVHRYGVTVPKYHWEESGQNGQVEKTLKNGIVCRQTYYLGMLEGETSYTFPFEDNIERVQVFSQDQLLRETYYFPNGRPKREVVYNRPEHTVIKEWYENGSIKSTEKWAGSLLAKADYYDTQQQHISSIDEGSGLRTINDTFGMLTCTDHFSNGQVEYRYTYYPNGTPKEVTPYKNGIVEGLRKTYYSSGEPMTIETWQGGKQQGITTIFQDGQKVQEVTYVDGIKMGKGRIYQDGAILIQEVNWKEDKLHGPSYTYIEGRVAPEWYYKGNKVTKGYYDSFTMKPHIE